MVTADQDSITNVFYLLKTNADKCFRCHHRVSLIDKMTKLTCFQNRYNADILSCIERVNILDLILIVYDRVDHATDEYPFTWMSKERVIGLAPLIVRCLIHVAYDAVPEIKYSIRIEQPRVTQEWSVCMQKMTCNEIFYSIFQVSIQ